jgi:hypothetical protein
MPIGSLIVRLPSTDSPQPRMRPVDALGCKGHGAAPVGDDEISLGPLLQSCATGCPPADRPGTRATSRSLGPGHAARDPACNGAPPHRSLISTSVLGPDRPGRESGLRKQLGEAYGTDAAAWQPVATYTVDGALPAMPPPWPLSRTAAPRASRRAAMCAATTGRPVPYEARSRPARGPPERSSPTSAAARAHADLGAPGVRTNRIRTPDVARIHRQRTAVLRNGAGWNCHEPAPWARGPPASSGRAWPGACPTGERRLSWPTATAPSPAAPASPTGLSRDTAAHAARSRGAVTRCRSSRSHPNHPMPLGGRRRLMAEMIDVESPPWRRLDTR